MIIDRVKSRETEMAIRQKIIGNPEEVVRKLENDVRQACVGSLLTFANRLLPNAKKNLNISLCLRPGYKVSEPWQCLLQQQVSACKTFQENSFKLQ